MDRAVDQAGQVVDVFVSARRDAAPADRFVQQAIGTTRVTPMEATTDRAPAYPAVLAALLPGTWHRTDRDANNPVECDHGRLKARLRPMRGREQDHSAKVVIVGHAFVQNLRRGRYGLAVEEPVNRRLAVAFYELAMAIRSTTQVTASTCPDSRQRNNATYVNSREDRGVLRADPATGRVVAHIRISDGGVLYAFGLGTLWVAQGPSTTVSGGGVGSAPVTPGKLYRIDPANNRVLGRPVPCQGSSRALWPWARALSGSESSTARP